MLMDSASGTHLVGDVDSSTLARDQFNNILMPFLDSQNQSCISDLHVSSHARLIKRYSIHGTMITAFRALMLAPFLRSTMTQLTWEFSAASITAVEESWPSVGQLETQIFIHR